MVVGTHNRMAMGASWAELALSQPEHFHWWKVPLGHPIPQKNYWWVLLPLGLAHTSRTVPWSIRQGRVPSLSMPRALSSDLGPLTLVPL